MKRATWRWAALSAAAISTAFVMAPSAGAADTPLSQGFEGGLNGWTATGFWHQKTSPQNVQVSSAISPTLVTSSGNRLPSAASGNGVAWFGEDSTGTFCGSDFANVTTQDGYLLPNNVSKSGCTSTQTYSGTLTSPSFDLTDAQSAILRFSSWWEIEAVQADEFDRMQVEYSVDNGSNWNDLGLLNPADHPTSKHHESYSNNGHLAEPSWKQYLVDLTPAIDFTQVKVRFNFRTVDRAYNGFRGWLIDNVQVSTPFDAGAPTITKVNTCQGLQLAPIWTVQGSNFVQGSKVYVNGSLATANIPASDRIEMPKRNAGAYNIKVVSPNGTTQSNLFQFGAGDCANQSGGPSGAEKRPSRVQVWCNYQVLQQTDTCTATVADATGGGIIPTGTVEFTSATGGIAKGTKCQLTRTPLSTVSSCTVEGIRVPKDKPLAISGTYSGDDKLEPTGGTTQFLLAAPGTGAYLQRIEPWSNSDFLNVTVDNPIDGTTVEAEGAASSNGSYCSSGLGGGSGRAAQALLSSTPGTDSGTAPPASEAFFGRASAKKRLPKIKGFSNKKLKIKKVKAVIAKQVKRNAKKGKVKLRVKFNSKKLNKTLGKKKSAKVVVRVTMKFKNGKVAVLHKVMKIKRKGAKGKGKKAAYTMVRPTARKAAASSSRGAWAADARRDAGASAIIPYTWAGQSNCGSLTIGGRIDDQTATGQVGINWQGTVSCTDGTSGNFVFAPPEIPSKTFPVQNGISYQFGQQKNQEGYPYRISQGFNLTGQLNNNGGTASGTAYYNQESPAVGNKACTAQAPSTFARTQ